MSDNLRRYRAIRNALNQMHPTVPVGNQARHLNTLAALINGIVAGKSTQLPKIADHQVTPTKRESRVKGYCRWLQNEHIDYAHYMLPFVETLLASVGPGPLVLAIDGSAIGRGCLCLMVSLIYRKRALPLCWMVVGQAKGHVGEDTHLALLKVLTELIPQDTRVILLGDGEFDGTLWLTTLEQAGWQYVCRTAKNSILIEDEAVFSFQSLGVGQDGFFWLPGVYFTNQHYGPLQAIVYQEKAYQDPLYLITNMDLALEACYWYRKRFAIETFFSDQKSRGFHLHKSHMSDPDRLDRLVMAAALAYIWIVYLGALALRDGWYRMIHRTTRCDLSLFQLGLTLLQHFINHSMPIPVAFLMVPFLEPDAFSKSVR